MPKIHGGVRVSSFISPSDASDTYGTHDSIYGIGGWREVATLADRDEVSTDRRREGMVVYVAEDQVPYRLTAENTWVPLVTTPGVSDVTGLTSALAGKEDSISAGTSAQYWRGDKTWRTLDTTAVVEGTNLYYTESRVDNRVRSLLLTGLVEQNARITESDTILGALGKTQGQLDAKQSANAVLTSITGVNTGSGLLKLVNGVASLDSASYLTANQIVTLSGDISGSGSTGIVTTLLAQTVTSKTLTGYAAGTNTPVSESDSILSAFGRLQGQVSAREAAISEGTPTQYWRGDKNWHELDTSAVVEADNKYFTEARVRSAMLSGYAVGANSAVDSTDTVLSAVGKLQAQVNAKEAGIATGTASQYFTGTKTWATLDTLAVTENQNLYFTASRVRAVDLAGLSVTNATIATTDSVLTAFGKAQGQLNNKQATSSVLSSVAGHSTGTGLLKLVDGVASLDAAAYLTANQSITLSGDVSGTGTTEITASISAATVTGKPLTGLGAGTNTAIVGTDTILDAFAKLQEQVVNRQPLTAALTAIANLSATSGLLRQTGTNNWSMDSSVYLTANQTITLSGDVTGSGTTAITASIPATVVTGKTLTGYAVGTNTAVTDTDTILSAIGRLQGQVSAREASIAAGTNAQYWRGDKTWQALTTSVVSEGTSQYFTEARVRASVLTGFSTNNAAILAGDSVLAAFGKAQGQLDNKQASSSVLTSVAAQSSGTGMLKLTSGTASLVSSLSPDVLGTGTPSDKTVLRGDGTWATDFVTVGVKLGGTSIELGVKDAVVVPHDAVILGWSVVSITGAGSLSMDVWKRPLTDGALPTVANSVTNGTPITVSSQQVGQNPDITAQGWTTSIQSNDILVFNLNSFTGFTNESGKIAVTIALRLARN